MKVKAFSFSTRDSTRHKDRALSSCYCWEYWYCENTARLWRVRTQPTHPPTHPPPNPLPRTSLATTTTSTFFLSSPCWTLAQGAGVSEVRTVLRMLGCRGGGEKKLLRISVSYLPQNGVLSACICFSPPADRFAVWKLNKERAWLGFVTRCTASSAEGKRFFEDADLKGRRYQCHLGFLLNR